MGVCGAIRRRRCDQAGGARGWAVRWERKSRSDVIERGARPETGSPQPPSQSPPAAVRISGPASSFPAVRSRSTVRATKLPCWGRRAESEVVGLAMMLGTGIAPNDRCAGGASRSGASSSQKQHHANKLCVRRDRKKAPTFQLRGVMKVLTYRKGIKACPVPSPHWVG